MGCKASGNWMNIAQHFYWSDEHGSLTLAIKEKRCEASKMAYFFVNFSIFFLSNV